MLRWLVVLIGMALASAVHAQDQAVLDRLERAFQGWLDRVGTKGALAVRFQDAPVVTLSLGIDADATVEMASLGKAITGVCVYVLVQQGLLRYDATLADVVGRGPNTSVEELLLHISGLREDSTQSDMHNWLGEPPHRSATVLNRVIARGAPEGRPGRYRYNNENYALLGLMIEAATGQDYETACRARVLDPAGATAVASQTSGAFLPWGGWAMRVADYAAFHRHWFGPDGEIGVAPLEHPHVEIETGLYHGLGTFFRVGNGTANAWYFGALCMPGRINIGSFAVRWAEDWSLVAAHDACVGWEDMFALDRVLAEAVFGRP